MRVLIIGQNTKIAKLFSYFCDDIYIVVDSSIDHFRSYKECEMYNIIETSTDIRKARSIIKRSREIAAWVKEYDIDLVFSNDKMSMIAAKISTLFITKKVLLVSTSHNSYAWLNELKVVGFTYLARFCVDGYLALASFVKNAMIESHFPESRILMLPNIVEPGLFENKQNYNINDGAVRIVYTSTIYRGKGQHALIESCKTLIKQGLHVKVDFIGDVIDAEYKKELDSFIFEHGLNECITFWGRLDNQQLREILNQYDIYVCPSLMEMSPYNVLEAKSVGLPIIATKVGGIPDMIVDGVNGLLVPANDVEALAASIKLLAEDYSLRKRLGLAASNDMTDKIIGKSAEKFKTFVERIGYHAKASSN